jgi:hypothetical protein
MSIETQTVLGVLAGFVAVINYAPYLIGVASKKMHPHAFSWIIFTLITGTVCVAQLSSGAGAGAWATGLTAVTTFCIAIFALRNGGYKVTRTDLGSFIGALVAIPVWIITANPLLAVVVLTFVEVLGFLPTYRKAWYQPFDESRLAFSLTILKYILALGAMQTYNVTVMLFPVALIVLSTILLIEINWRRNYI